MEEGDGESYYALYALHHFHWPPSTFIQLPRREKAAVIAMIDEGLRQKRQKP